MRNLAGLLGAAALSIGSLVCGSAASAQVLPTRTITIDENGNGTVTGGTSPVTLTSGMAADSGPGGLSSVLTYALPAGFTVVPGDVLLTDADFNNLPLDVIRFNQVVGATVVPGSIAFYSDNVDGSDALGDTIAPPSSFYPNTATLPEVGLEGGLNGATYTPTANQPGFVPGFLVTYNFISDSAVPEAATWAMMIVGFGAMGLALRRRRKTLALA